MFSITEQNPQIVGKSISTIKRAMRELCKYGAVERTPRFRKDGGQTSNLYKIVPCNFEEIPKSEAQNNVDQDQFEMCETLQEDISFSETEINEPARPCTPSMDENNSFEEPEKNTTDALGHVHIINETTGNTSNRFKLSKYMISTKNRVSYWFESRIFKKNEPGGGHGRPPRNLSI